MHSGRSQRNRSITQHQYLFRDAIRPRHAEKRPVDLCGIDAVRQYQQHFPLQVFGRSGFPHGEKLMPREAPVSPGGIGQSDMAIRLDTPYHGKMIVVTVLQADT